ncbi:MAG: hypothetical protein JW984_15310 [Deltaproteobacteria bacterium]|uniref:Peptidase M15A C-terminal domain-containing protein n=1 Tax=Candidatus Zymogenus saltonus TaxID=2844893 RepID=A0A9D8PPU0_9DELT|nr:hypothetical protein [Candidatus Zymogenus saltonus]
MELMTAKDWENIKYFSPEERWGDPHKMERELIFLLDDLRDIFECPFVIHCGLDLYGHSKDSRHHVPVKDSDGNILYHYADAADFHIVGIDYKDAVDLMTAFIGPPPGGLAVANKIGLGIYPHWYGPGFHLDTRGSRARWGAVDRGGKQVYVSFKEAYEAIK